MTLLLRVAKTSKQQESLRLLSERNFQARIELTQIDLNKKLFDHNLAPLPRSSIVNAIENLQINKGEIEIDGILYDK